MEPSLTSSGSAGSSASLPTYHIFRDKHGIPQFSPKRGTQALKDALIYAFPTLDNELQLMQTALRKFFNEERGSKFVFELPQNDLQTSLGKIKEKEQEGETSPIQTGRAALRTWKMASGYASAQSGRGRRVSRASSRASSRPSSRPPSRALSRVSSRAESGTPITRPETPFDDVSGDGGAGINGNRAGKMMTWILSSGEELGGRKKAPYDPVKRRKVAENRGMACDKHRASKTTCDPELCPRNKAYLKGNIAEKEIGDLSAIRCLPTVEEAKRLQVIFSAEATKQFVQTEIPPGVDFWELPDHHDLPFHDTDTSLWVDTSRASTNSHSHSMSSWTSHSPGSTSILGFNSPDSTLDKDFQVASPEFDAYRQNQLPLNKSFLEFQPQLQTGSPRLGEEVTPALFSEDPFMGSNSMTDDYGWVLSHVGSL